MENSDSISMAKRSPIIWPLISFVVLAVMLSGVPIDDTFAARSKKNKEAQTTLWKRGDQFVRIEQRDITTEGVAPANDHPVSFSPEQLASMLGSLQINSSKKKKKKHNKPVFTEDQLEILADTISRGLAKAGPDADLTFAITGYHPKGLGKLKKYAMTTARLFYQGKKLNLIFGKLHEDRHRYVGLMDKAYDRNDRRVNPLEPGSRSSAIKTSWTWLDTPGVQLAARGGVERADWVTIDAEAALGRMASERKKQEITENIVTQTGRLQEDTARIGVEQELLRREIDKLREELGESKKVPASDGAEAAPKVAAPPAPAAAVPTVPATSAATPAPPRSAVERLTLLKELREGDLITEDEYQAKRRQILDEL